MEIERINQPPIQPRSNSTHPVHESGHPRQSGEARRGQQKDQLLLSKEAQELRDARKAVQAASEVRGDKVAALKEAVEGGSYWVPDDVLLQSLLGRLD